jgi:hypothetical protein
MSDKEMADAHTNTPALPRIDEDVSLFVREINSLVNTLPPAMFTIAAVLRDANDRLLHYADKYGTLSGEDKRERAYVFKPPYDAHAVRLRTQIDNVTTANTLVPRVFVLALVGQFDAFVGRLLRDVFLLQPKVFMTSDKTVTLAEILDLGSLELATEHLLDKEIESVIRKSHSEQFVWMENKFNIELRKDLSSWPIFVEITERRNLYAHTNGVVSDQYLMACRKHGVILPSDCTKGTTLSLTPEYFQDAYECIFEIGIKLSQVLWRKLRPDQTSDADKCLTKTTFDLLVAGKYNLACVLLDFACEVLKKYSSDESRRVYTINRAQAYKWANNEDKCQSILSGEDWSACGLNFKLAVAVLRNDYNEAASLMRVIGVNGAPHETDYHEWPLFKEFRKTDEFAASYEEVYSKPFVHIERAMRKDETTRIRNSLITLMESIKEDGLPDAHDKEAGV